MGSALVHITLAVKGSISRVSFFRAGLFPLKMFNTRGVEHKLVSILLKCEHLLSEDS